MTKDAAPDYDVFRGLLTDEEVAYLRSFYERAEPHLRKTLGRVTGDLWDHSRIKLGKDERYQEIINKCLGALREIFDEEFIFIFEWYIFWWKTGHLWHQDDVSLTCSEPWKAVNLALLLDKSPDTKKDGVDILPRAENQALYTKTSNCGPMAYNDQAGTILNWRDVPTGDLVLGDPVAVDGKPHAVTVNGIEPGDGLMFRSRLFHRTSFSQLDEGDVFKKSLYLRFYPAASTYTGLDLRAGAPTIQHRFRNLSVGQPFSALDHYSSVRDYTDEIFPGKFENLASMGGRRYFRFLASLVKRRLFS